MTLLIGDVGGTHTRLALPAADGTLGAVSLHETASIGDFAGLLHARLSGASRDPREVDVRLALAAPIDGDRATFVNVALTVHAAALQEALQTRSITLLNDLEAAAYGIPLLGPDDRVSIGDARARPRAAIGVLGPGTGMGVSGLVPVDGRWKALAGEGGHVTVAGHTALEREIIARAAQRFEHVSVERLVSGPGLLLTYQILCAMNRADPALATPAEVARAALHSGDAHAAQALEVFFGLLGGAAGDLALTLGAQGGIYIAGGVVPKLIDAALGSRLREAFESKGRYRDYMARIPLYIVTHPYPAMLGLAHLDRVRAGG
jgi:glucokinase